VPAKVQRLCLHLTQQDAVFTENFSKKKQGFLTGSSKNDHSQSKPIAVFIKKADFLREREDLCEEELDALVRDIEKMESTLNKRDHYNQYKFFLTAKLLHGPKRANETGSAAKIAVQSAVCRRAGTSGKTETNFQPKTETLRANEK
jgi:hypothetical protein